MSELEVRQFASPADWQKWLEKNHAQPDGIWLKYAKKGTGIITINHSEALETALCYGWIDSQAKSFDAKFYLVKFTPRRVRSVWSKVNRERVEQLIAEGKMRPSGLAQVEAAKADGRWQAAYAPQSRAELPDDFKSALAKNKPAAEFFKTLNKANKYAFIWRLHHVKKTETRARNIEKYIEMLADHEVFHQ